MTRIHNLKIFHSNSPQKATIKKPVINECYDEIVFCEPTEFFFHMLNGEQVEGMSTGLVLPPSNQPIQPASKEENKIEEEKVQQEEIINEDDQEAEKDEEMQPEGEDKEDAKMEPDKDKAKEEDNFELVIANSTYDVTVGANNETIVNVEQFFESHNDKLTMKKLQEALKNLKEETEYLRGEVRKAEETINERKKETCKHI